MGARLAEDVIDKFHLGCVSSRMRRMSRVPIIELGSVLLAKWPRFGKPVTGFAVLVQI